MRTPLSQSLVILALTNQVSTSSSQQPLAETKRPSGFPRESIFTNRLDLTTLPSPKFLPPEHKIQAVNTEPVVNLGSKFTECGLPDSSGSFDIGIVGHPFDLGVSFRPGARFGPNSVRNAGRRLWPGAGWR
jgi:agmatinase